MGHGHVGRWIRDGIGLALLGATCVGAASLRQQHLGQEAALDGASHAIDRLQREVARRAAAREGALGPEGWPISIDPDWFVDDPPMNTLASADRAWLEIAGEDEWMLQHPRVRILAQSDTASLWYNPRLGVVRARVPVMVSDDSTVRAYNRINRSRLSEIFSIENVENFFPSTSSEHAKSSSASTNASSSDTSSGARASSSATDSAGVTLSGEAGLGIERWSEPPKVIFKRKVKH